MTRIEGLPVLTAAQMRVAEERAAPTPDAIYALMNRAGEGVAEAARRLAGGAEVLVLCGPGNNGGDGWVAAASLARSGHPVRVAMLAEPATDAARRARGGWSGPVEVLGEVAPAPVLVDALFGTGLSRPLAPDARAALARLVDAARSSIAVDLPSGVSTDDGALLGEVPRFDLTLALGAPKPAHLLQPGAERCGEVRVVDLGIEVTSDAWVLDRPALPPPGPADYKYSRGMVAVVAGAMPGATLLASTSAMRAGAGYVALLGGDGRGGPHALVHRALDDAALGERRIGAVLIGPGLGRDDAARAKLDKVLATDHPLVIDGDALMLLRPERLRARGGRVVLTPHVGEFKAMFGDGGGSKLDRARVAAARAGATVVFKGADTAIAAPDGRARLAPPANPWLGTAGSGDTLAGVVAAMLARGGDPLEAAAAALWLGNEAARRCGAAFIADDLAEALTPARASL